MKRIFLLAAFVMIIVLLSGCEGNKVGVSGENQKRTADSLQETGEGLSDEPHVITERNQNDRQEAQESEFKAEFLGVDSSKIQTCRIYHGGIQEELDLASAKGKYFVQMLSDFLKDPEFVFGELEGGLMLDNDVGQLEEEAKQHTENYYIFFRFQEPPTAALSEMYGNCAAITREISPFDNMIVYVEPEEWLVLEGFWGSDYRAYRSLGFWPGDERMGGLWQRFEAWKDITDWQAAFDELDMEREARQARMEDEKAEEMSKRAAEGEASFLGVGSSRIMSCKMYHGASQEELDLTTERGKELLQMLSGFFEGEEYSYEYYPKSSIDDFLLEEELEEAAAENGGGEPTDGIEADGLSDLERVAADREENYYFLLQFAEPPDITLEDKEEESVVTISGYDIVVFEVGQKGKRVILHPGMGGLKELSFDSSIGIRKQNAVKRFQEEYEAWEQEYKGQ